MDDTFHERFDINIGQEETKKRFLNRAHNEIFTNLMNLLASYCGADERINIERRVCSTLGIKYRFQTPLHAHIGDNFYSNLQAIEALYDTSVPDDSGFNLRGYLDVKVRIMMTQMETDLGIRWERGKFRPAGSPLLDKILVNDVLGILNDRKYVGVLKAFEKGLDHLMHATAKPALLADVIADMHEALEAVAKVVTGKDSELSRNQELFLSTIETSKEYQPILRAYIAYANKLGRHAGEGGQAKPLPSPQETESFVYLTGIFIRLALSSYHQG